MVQCYTNINPIDYIVHEAAKAANIWNDPPLIKDLSPTQAKKFYDTVIYLYIIYDIALAN